MLVKEGKWIDIYIYIDIGYRERLTKDHRYINKTVSSF